MKLDINVEFIADSQKLVARVDNTITKLFITPDTSNDNVLDFLIKVLNQLYPNIWTDYENDTKLVFYCFIAKDCFSMPFCDDEQDFNDSYELKELVKFYMDCIKRYVEAFERECLKKSWQLYF